MTRVTVIDYGLGNLYSVARALRAANAEVELTADPDVVRHAERLVLPGVGAFRDGMAGLELRGLIEPIREFVGSGRPLFGICLGMQLLMSRGTEFGDAAGLALVGGSVVSFDADGRPVRGKIPHVGWSKLVAKRPWAGSALAAVPDGSHVYFSHSYFPAPDDGGIVLATATHAGVEVCSFIHRDNIQASQFHPDMSGDVGLAIMKGFVDQPE
jgi:glutamine amidotransferase